MVGRCTGLRARGTMMPTILLHRPSPTMPCLHSITQWVYRQSHVILSLRQPAQLHFSVHLIFDCFKTKWTLQLPARRLHAVRRRSSRLPQRGPNPSYQWSPRPDAWSQVSEAEGKCPCQSAEHILQVRALHDTLRHQFWPVENTVARKLFGSQEDLQRTAAFVRGTGVSILVLYKNKKKPKTNESFCYSSKHSTWFCQESKDNIHFRSPINNGS